MSSHKSPIRDDIFFLLSQLYKTGIPFPAIGMAKIIFKHSGRYSSLESARTKVQRELNRLNKKEYAERSMIDWLGIEVNGWVLTKEGRQFILEGRNHIRASPLGESSISATNSHPSPPLNLLQTEGGPGGSEG